MASNDSGPVMEPFKPPDLGSGKEALLCPPASAADDSPSNERLGQEHCDTLFEQSRPSPSANGSSIDAELHALKAKIQELEDRSTFNPFPHSSPKQASETQDHVAAMEQYRRMEKCLYTHRKEWEKRNGNYDPMMIIGFSKDLPFNGPWAADWDIVPHHPYNRPNPFDPSHRCHGEEDGSAPKDEFDYTIDFGNRRDRLRKTFEWEMDRLYLAEEMDRRRRQKVELQTNATEQAERHNSDPHDSGSEQSVCMTVDVAWDEFQRLGRSRKKKGCYLHILTGDPTVRDNEGFERAWAGPLERRARKTGHQTLAISKKSQFPERIRIYSDVVFTILDKILRSTESHVDLAKDPVPTVFTRPFKALVYCEEGLESWCRALEGEAKGSSNDAEEHAPPLSSVLSPETDDFEGTLGDDTKTSLLKGQPAAKGDNPLIPSDQSINLGLPATKSRDHVEGYAITDNQAEQTTGNNGGADDSGDDNSDSESEALDAVLQSPRAPRELAFFLKTLRSQVLHRREYLKGDDCGKVFFSDLWHLFLPGTDIVQSNRKQVYRVVHVTSTKHRMMSALERWGGHPDYHIVDGDENKKIPRPDFRITCVYIDFDGRVFGPVAKIFDIKSFDGQREITSFDVFPLRLLPMLRDGLDDAERDPLSNLPPATRIRQKLIDRGKRFLEAITKKHMYYAGPTLDTREDFEGQVVVDFEAALPIGIPARPSAERPLIRSVLNLILEDYAEERPCQASCCYVDEVYDDTAIDLRLGMEYINSLLPKPGDQNPASVSILPQTLEALQKDADPDKCLLSDNDLLILSYRVFGFLLRNRRFAQLDLDFLSEIQMRSLDSAHGSEQYASNARESNSTGSAAAFDRLVLEKGHRSMIESLIAQHFRDKDSKKDPDDQRDAVRGKEGAAELFGKPLFQITCGTTAKEVEHALEKNFALANRWDCILLLDEADVFLAERTREDFKRNGLVAVFLRVLEYYTGILFLTTNRVGDFDEAFTSRIHMSLYYPDLSQDKTLQIFEINLKMIAERFARKERKIVIDQMAIGAFASQHFIDKPDARWNGRQIRNACQTALALAEFEAQGNSHRKILKPDAVVQLTVEHFKTVRNAYLEFTDYMKLVYGTSAARKAGEGKVRAILVDENNNFVGSVGGAGRLDRKAAYAQQSKTPLYADEHQPQENAQFQQHQAYHTGGCRQPGHYQTPHHGYHQSQVYPRPESFGAPSQPQSTQYPSTPPGQTSRGIPFPTHMQESQVPGDIGRSQRPLSSDNSFRESQGQFDIQQGRYVPQQQPNPQWPSRSVQDAYDLSGGPRQGLPSHLTPSRGSGTSETYGPGPEQLQERPPGV
ncbi:Putative ATPase, AAA-type, core, P-loop containing nucleoside triphosphate hydrolase [Colletotrichum destructivum]|uniref:ATPase, AAA-type, core, P-loop containing nucleoside triphosphate hydrolase n=1 Tax=Colletotrichum destructivum TaxID=34406 RepID=A0AAX4IR83_9PEZI|nr:Putative ATPase, AAA-type, core, P-loop containing nucleoside triphosphate hydrolase [Colletotrichum destructivum]